MKKRWLSAMRKPPLLFSAPLKMALRKNVFNALLIVRRPSNKPYDDHNTHRLTAVIQCVPRPSNVDYNAVKLQPLHRRKPTIF